MSERAYVVIPPRNEAPRIGRVLEAALSADEWLVDTDAIIVVDNSSSDDTVEVARSFTPHVLTCDEKGKGFAMDKGVAYARSLGAQTITFLDADQVGLSGSHVNALTEPVVQRKRLMTIGILGGRSWLGKTSIVAALSGQRSIRTEVWNHLSPCDLTGWRIEAALNALFRNAHRENEVEYIYLEGVSQVNKFAKEYSTFEAGKEYAQMSVSALRGLWSRAGL